MSYDQLLKAADEYLLTGDTVCLSFDTPDRCYIDSEEFWKRYSEATGKQVPEDEASRSFFRCAC